MSNAMKGKKIDIWDGIPATIKGISCLIYLTSYTYQPPFKGSVFDCDSDIDYKGYEEIDWELYNLRGYRMRFLENKCTEKDKKDIRTMISVYMYGQRKNDDV